MNKGEHGHRKTRHPICQTPIMRQTDVLVSHSRKEYLWRQSSETLERCEPQIVLEYI